MRILQLHTRYRQRGGEDVVVDAEARVLREAGHDVRQVIARNPDSNLKAVGNLVLSPWNPAAARRVMDAVEEFEPDIAHVHNTWFAMSPAVIRAVKRAGVPVVMTLHNYRLTCANGLLFRDGQPCELCIGSHPWHAVRYGCYRDSRLQSVPGAGTIALHRRLDTWADAVDTFIVLTEFQRELMVRAGLPGEKLVVKANFVSDPGPRPIPPSESNTVLYVGRLSAEKGVDLLVDAWRQSDLGELSLLIVGEGPRRDRLKKASSANIGFSGWLPAVKIQETMRTSRALVMPSQWYETLGHVILESFAAGLPTLVSDIGPPARVVEEVIGGGWVYQSGGSHSLVQALEHIVDETWCDAGGRLARQAYERRFSETGAGDALVEIYSSALRLVL